MLLHNTPVPHWEELPEPNSEARKSHEPGLDKRIHVFSEVFQYLNLAVRQVSEMDLLQNFWSASLLYLWYNSSIHFRGIYPYRCRISGHIGLVEHFETDYRAQY
jgi:hypothetical protein